MHRNSKREDSKALDDTLDLYIAYSKTLDEALEHNITDPNQVNELIKYAMAMREAWHEAVELVPHDLLKELRILSWPRWVWKLVSWRWRLTDKFFDDNELLTMNKTFIAYENLHAKPRRTGKPGNRPGLPDQDC